MSELAADSQLSGEMSVADSCQNLQLIQDTIPYRDSGKEEQGRELRAEQTVSGCQRVLGCGESIQLDLVVGEHYHLSHTDC